MQDRIYCNQTFQCLQAEGRCYQTHAQMFLRLANKTAADTGKQNCRRVQLAKKIQMESAEGKKDQGINTPKITCGSIPIRNILKVDEEEIRHE